MESINTLQDEKRENLCAITVNDALLRRYTIVFSHLVRVVADLHPSEFLHRMLEIPEDFVLQVLCAAGSFEAILCGRLGNCGQVSRWPVRRPIWMKNMVQHLTKRSSPPP